MRIYRDNNIIGPNAEDLPHEAEALKEIERGCTSGRWQIEWVVSRRTANELDKAPTERQMGLRADDHTVKGFQNLDLETLFATIGAERKVASPGKAMARR
jgi:hypothetical protein